MQVVVAAPGGRLNKQALARVLQREFGRVTVGEGEWVNGIPANMLVLEER